MRRLRHYLKAGRRFIIQCYTRFSMAVILARLSKQDLLRHFALFGATGSGKTTFAEGIFHQIASDKNCSAILLEPHGDFSLRAGLMRCIDRDRLVFVSTAINRLADMQGEPYTFTFNPFEHDGSVQMKERLRHELTGVFTELLQSAAHSSQYGITVNMAAMLSNTIAVCLESEAPSIINLKRIFTSNNADLLHIGKNFPHPEVQQYFLHVFESEQSRATRSAVLSKLSYLLSDATLYNILCSKTSTLQLEKFIDQSKVIVVHTPVGISSFTQSVLGRLIVARVLAHAMTKEAIPIQQRRKTFLFIEEVQEYATQSISTILQSARKFSTGLFLSSQSWKQLQDRQLITTIQTNTLWKATGVIDAANAAELARHMSATTDDILTLKNMQFLCKKMGNSPAFKITVRRLPDAMFYTKTEAKKLYRSLIDSKLYVKVSDLLQPTPPPSTLPPEPSSSTKTTKKKKKNNDNPFDNLPPAF